MRKHAEMLATHGTIFHPFFKYLLPLIPSLRLSVAAMQGMTLRILLRGGLVVSALDFRSGGRWFEPSLCRLLSFDKKLHSTCLSSLRCINGYQRS